MSQVISQQWFNLWKEHTNKHRHCIHRITSRTIKLFGLRAVNILRNSITLSCGRAVQRRKEKKKKTNQFQIDVCFLVDMFDLEFTFICSKAPRSRCNGCLRHYKPPYLACPMRIYLWLEVSIVSFPGTGGLARKAKDRSEWEGNGRDETGTKCWVDPGVILPIHCSETLWQ